MSAAEDEDRERRGVGPVANRNQMSAAELAADRRWFERGPGQRALTLREQQRRTVAPSLVKPPSAYPAAALRDEDDDDDATEDDDPDPVEEPPPWTVQLWYETRWQWLERLRVTCLRGLTREQRYERVVAERNWLDRQDRSFGYPRVARLIELLGSDAPLAEKTKKVSQWVKWATETLCSPALVPTTDHVYEFWFSGATLTALCSHSLLTRSPEWAAYQRDLAAAREGRRPPRDRAQEKRIRRARIWLAAHREQFLKNPTPSLRAQAQKRLEILGFEGTVEMYYAMEVSS